MSLQPVPVWQQQLVNVISDPEELVSRLQLDKSWLKPAKAASQLFPLKVPEPYLKRIKLGDPFDPLLRQVLPLGDELKQVPGFDADPLKEKNFTESAGVLHKYHGRVLWVMTGSCAIHCRYCFRRQFPYEDNHLLGSRIHQALAYIRQHEDIEEVILSGGDPLSISDRRIGNLVAEIEKISHIQRLRIHTRLPIVIPQRLTSVLLNSLTRSRLRVVVVFHVNHAHELDDSIQLQLENWRTSKLWLLNQAVLLKGVNDSVLAQVKLAKRLMEVGVKPYYLHLLDKTAGTAHFDVSVEDAKVIHTAMMNQLPGYLVPKLVREEPGQSAKTWV